ncbi:MAG: peptide chain release factor N(5)-glutamine methyltransferase [Rickettsiales bacterium]
MVALRKITTHTIQDTLRDAVIKLQDAKFASGSLDARILLQHVLHVSREELLLAMDEPMSEAQRHEYFSLIDLRLKHHPISHLIGKREFYGMDFKVTNDTLDPRPDSETLIDAVLEYCTDSQKTYKILDLGVGTGCLCLSLLKAISNATAIGVDISEAALAVAKENTIRLGLQSRIAFLASNWCEKVAGTFDIIVANPPYIPSASIESLAPEVALHEPKLALDGGKDGLDCYRQIMKSLPELLAEDGVAFFEIGMGQQDALAQLAHEQGLNVMAMKKDLGGIIRCVMITR